MSRQMDASVSVIEPIEKAFAEVKKILFSPFDLERWFIIGFCAWLAFIGTSGGGPGGGGGRGGDGSGFNASDFNAREEFTHVKDWVLSNLYWLIPAIIGCIIAFTIIGLVLTWIRSRGQFMFLYCVANNKAEVSIPWTKYREHANSLFLFRVVFGLISFAIVSLYAGIVGLCAFFLARGTEGDFQVTAPMIIVLIVGGLGLIALFIVIGIIIKFTMDFVVPIMYLRTTSCMDAWCEFLEIVSARKGALCVYLLFQIVIGIAIQALVMAAILATCCIACCFLMIPYIHWVVLLPVLVFERAYSLHYLRQFGSDFDVFAPEEAAPVPVIVM